LLPRDTLGNIRFRGRLQSGLPGSLQGVRNHVQAVREKVPVQIQRHGRRLVVVEDVLDVGFDAQRSAQSALKTG